MDEDRSFPYYLVRAASQGGGVVSMHWTFAAAERKRLKLTPEVFAHVVAQATYLQLPDVATAAPEEAARRRN